MKIPSKRKFRKALPITGQVILEIGYMLGSHIRKGLYEPVSAEQSQLLRGVYDDSSSKASDVDPASTYANDKFDLFKLGKQVDQVTPLDPSAGSSVSAE